MEQDYVYGYAVFMMMGLGIIGLGVAAAGADERGTARKIMLAIGGTLLSMAGFILLCLFWKLALLLIL